MARRARGAHAPTGFFPKRFLGMLGDMSESELQLPSKLDEYLGNYRVTDGDERSMLALEPLLEGISRMFGEHCEIILHSLADLANSIILIKNGKLTGRGIGAPITDKGLQTLAEAFESRQDVIGPYFSTTDGGKTMRSVLTLLRNEEDNPIGFFCMNFDLTVSMLEFFKLFSPDAAFGVPVAKAATRELYPLALKDLIQQTLEAELAAIALLKGISASEKNKLLVQALEGKNIFSIKGSVEIVAREMGVSRHTIYSHLRCIRGGDCSEV